MKNCLFTWKPTGMNRQELYNALFGRARQGSARWQQSLYQGPGAAQLQQYWDQIKTYYLSLQYGWSPSAFDMTDFFRNFEEKDCAIQTKIDELRFKSAGVAYQKGFLSEEAFSGCTRCQHGRWTTMKLSRKVKEGHAGAYISSLLDATTMKLFSGEVHMRDERGSSVSLCHLSQRALGVMVLLLCLFGFCLGGFWYLCCFWFCFIFHPVLHNHCKRSAYCQLGLSFSQNVLLTVRAFVRVRDSWKGRRGIGREEKSMNTSIWCIDNKRQVQSIEQ